MFKSPESQLPITERLYLLKQLIDSNQQNVPFFFQVKSRQLLGSDPQRVLF